MKKILAAMWKERIAYLELTPAFLLLLFVAFGPVVYGIILGLTDFNLLRPTQTSFVGLKNFFAQLLNSRYHHALWNTLFYTVCITGFSFIAGLGISLMLNAQKLRAKSFFRILILIPWVITPVVVAVGWSILMRNEYGFINYVLIKWGFSNINFLGDLEHTLKWILVPMVWRSVPFVIIMLYARLKGIQGVLYEAATVDGATKWQQFLYITLPELKAVSAVLVLYMCLMNAKVFDVIWVLTMGGPGDSTQVAMTYVYDVAFQRWQLGNAAAASYVPMMILFVIGAFYIRLVEKD